MKLILNYLKKNRLPVPIGLGLLMSKIPYGKRPGLGILYSQQQNAIDQYKSFSEQNKQKYIYEKFFRIFSHAYLNIKFYRDLYDKAKINPDIIKSYSDIEKVPVISKKDLLEYDLKDRSFPLKNALLVNTGGSSGKTLSFYMDPERYGNEWAHIHNMWSKYNFKPSDLKITFDGRAKNNNNKIVYDFARNSLLYNIYGDPLQLSKELIKVTNRHSIRYLHGYPSAMYEFALFCETNEELLHLLRKTLVAAFLSSEFPSPHYRNKIEEVFGIPTQSFYGHTETCVLAVEADKYIYDTYQTYGFAEAIRIDNKHHLVGTSYFNFASPLIRYDTEDIIEPLNPAETILSQFKIVEGRLGEFVIDKNGKKIPLTGLIYGRHHKLFDFSEHIQVFQDTPGVAIILFVSNKDISEVEAKKLFNSENVDITFKFYKSNKPILSTSGKVNLKINSLDQKYV